MKTLVIHPDDRSTDFLRPIYRGIEDKTVITTFKNMREISELIDSHDRVIMMGHGSPLGLFSMDITARHPYIIHSAQSIIEALNQKDYNVFIWCYASNFVFDNNLKGFSTGMFISEVGEAITCGIKPNSKISEQVTNSNNFFSEIAGRYLIDSETKNPTDLFQKVSAEYSTIVDENPVAKYNLQRLIYR
jgi:hypothetical protein